MGIAFTITPDSAIATEPRTMRRSDPEDISPDLVGEDDSDADGGDQRADQAVEPNRSWRWAIARPKVNSGVSETRTIVVPAGTSRIAE